VISVERTLAGPERDHASRNEASEKARELARGL
jgi:FMN-dependent NADH-azoreductase